MTMHLLKLPAEESKAGPQIVPPAQLWAELPASGHVIVVGNEKGGSGKSTTAMHVAVALMHIGQRVATIDLDSRQKSFTHYIEHRRDWAKRAKLGIKVPVHFCIAHGDTLRLDENEAIEFAGFADAVSSVQESHDFIVVDTPGTDCYLSRLAHSMADTLITPLNDSFIDLDVLGTVDPGTYAVTGESHYAAMVTDARRQRQKIDGTRIDWIVVRNRLSTLDSHNMRLVGNGLTELAARLDFRFAVGLTERVIYRELFPRGLTALDSLHEGNVIKRPNASHLTARNEVMTLLDSLELKLAGRSQRVAAARLEWLSSNKEPLEMHDVIGD